MINAYPRELVSFSQGNIIIIIFFFFFTKPCRWMEQNKRGKIPEEKHWPAL